MESAYFYEIRLPSGHRPNVKYPTVFAMHGRGSNERDMLDLTMPLYDEFIVIAIRGNRPTGPGYQFYELKSVGNPVIETFQEAVRDLEAFVEYATEKYPIDPERRYLLGFSQGAILSMTLAHTMVGRLKGIAALNGYVPDFVKTESKQADLRQLSVFISHGEHDQVFPIRIGDETAAYFRALTVHCTYRSYPTGHNVSEQNQRDFVDWLRQDVF